MIPEDELECGELRLLEVDNRIVLPINTNTYQQILIIQIIPIASMMLTHLGTSPTAASPEPQ